MTRILITGALGHIGSSFIHGLSPGDFEEVVLLDDLSAERYCSLFNLPPGVPFRFIEADVCTSDLEAMMKNIDVVVHLAAITNAAASFGIQEKVEHVNYVGTERVAEACCRTGSRLLFLSTTSVYGTQATTVDEDCPLESLNPQSPYATSKLRAEQMLASLGAENGLRYFIGRYATIFGTSIGMRFHTAVNKFCWQASVGQPLTVWRTALDQVRPYLDVNDAVRAVRFVLQSDLFRQSRVQRRHGQRVGPADSGRDTARSRRYRRPVRGHTDYESALVQRFGREVHPDRFSVRRKLERRHRTDISAAQRHQRVESQQPNRRRIGTRR